MELLNIIKACNSLKKRCSVVLVTSDKCYYNFETKRGYKENDILGEAIHIAILNKQNIYLNH